MEDQRDTTNYCPLCEQNARAHNDLHEEVERLNGLLDEVRAALYRDPQLPIADRDDLMLLNQSLKEILAKRKGKVGG